jgi:hypothetical protein
VLTGPLQVSFGCFPYLPGCRQRRFSFALCPGLLILLSRRSCTPTAHPLYPSTIVVKQTVITDAQKRTLTTTKLLDFNTLFSNTLSKIGHITQAFTTSKKQISFIRSQNLFILKSLISEYESFLNGIQRCGAENPL